MRVYYSSATPLNRLVTCDSLVCNYLGWDEEHVTFTSLPLFGVGPYLYEASVAYDTIRVFEYRHPFRRDGGQFFAVPLSIAETFNLVEIDFFTKMNQDWDVFAVTLYQGYREYDDNKSEEWGKVWISRPGVATARLLEDTRDSVGERRRALIKLADSFDPLKDYVIYEEGWEKPTKRNARGWKLTLLAGANVPPWAFYPWAWSMWVSNEKVQRSAVEYILRHVPEAELEVQFAVMQANKPKNRTNTARAWRIVADRVGSELGSDLGVIDYGSDTAVRAMPLKIANRMGTRTRIGEPWVPPLPRPEHAHPDESGRVLLAKPEGTELS